MSNQKPETSRTKTAEATGKRTNLDGQYGSIGISAVAAALPYAGKAKNSAHAPARDNDQRSQSRARSILAV